ncbi:DUF309 domain-containing protein [Salipaludibacillus sp. CF4.18]|uniref:DUF309 domain-containing protein n=1 Tax=Salipaludibacillus sp. CF4.18 TaxID=3373081 RepID=UPI003EE65FAA
MKKYANEYIEYLLHFQSSRDYFECHEIMEEFWLENDRDLKWLLLIQLAVAVYHERQKNFTGSLRLYRKTLSYLRNQPALLDELSIHGGDLEQQVKSRIKTILNEGEYEPFNLPLTDDMLIKKCEILSKEKGWVWLYKNDASNPDLTYRHKRRDRSEVIEARHQSLLYKQQKRGGLKR